MLSLDIFLFAALLGSFFPREFFPALTNAFAPFSSLSLVPYFGPIFSNPIRVCKSRFSAHRAQIVQKGTLRLLQTVQFDAFFLITCTPSVHLIEDFFLNPRRTRTFVCVSVRKVDPNYVFIVQIPSDCNERK